MTRDEIVGKIFDIAVEKLMVDTEEAESITRDTPLEDIGYGMDDLDFLDILCEIEETFGVTINEHELSSPCSINKFANAVEKTMRNAKP